MRLFRHLFPRAARSLFPEDRLQRIAEAVADGERRHRGELCFAVESALPALAVLRGMPARARAEDVFAQLRVWDTEANNGVLIYLLLADQRIEIVADRGLRGRVDDAQWRAVCAAMETHLRDGDPEAAALTGAAAVSNLLAAHFPRVDGDMDDNELADLPRIL